jgi:hypothetical protein
MDEMTTVVDQAARAEWLELAKPAGTAANVASGRRTAWVTNTALNIYQQTEKFLF